MISQTVFPPASISKLGEVSAPPQPMTLHTLVLMSLDLPQALVRVTFFCGIRGRKIPQRLTRLCSQYRMRALTFAFSSSVVWGLKNDSPRSANSIREINLRQKATSGFCVPGFQLSALLPSQLNWYLAIFSSHFLINTFPEMIYYSYTNKRRKYPLFMIGKASSAYWSVPLTSDKAL